MNSLSGIPKAEVIAKRLDSFPVILVVAHESTDILLSAAHDPVKSKLVYLSLDTDVKGWGGNLLAQRLERS